MKENQIEITIIIPIYNAKTLIKKCLLSICNQSFEKIEILCIDDGSTDDTCSVIEEINDSRITLVKLKHFGVSHARNVGLTLAKGVYVQFLDADDTLEPDCCKIAYETAKKYDADCVFFGANFISSSNVPEWMLAYTDIKQAFYPHFEDSVLFDIAGTKPFVWNQIIKRDLLIKNKINFDESLILGEDQAFQFAYLPYAKNITVIENKLYNHYISEDSATFASYKSIREKISFHLDVVSNIIKQSKRHPLRFQRRVCNWAIDFLYGDIIRYSDEEIIKKANRVFSKSKLLLITLPPETQEKAKTIGALKNCHKSLYALLKQVIR